MKFLIDDETQDFPVKIYLQIAKDGNVDIYAKQGTLCERLLSLTNEGCLYLYSELIHNNSIEEMGFKIQKDGRIKVVEY